MTKELSKRMVGVLSQQSFIISWMNLGDGDAGEIYEAYASSQRSIQFFGTFDEGSIFLEGSNDGLNWKTLTDPQGNPILMISPGIEMVTELTVFLRPRVEGGGKSTNLSAFLFVKESL